MITIKNEGSYSDYSKRIKDLASKGNCEELDKLKDEIYNDGENLSVQEVADLIAEIHRVCYNKNESVMTYRIPLNIVESIIKSEDFYNKLLEYYGDKPNYLQMSRDLSQAINFTQRMSAVSRPVNNVIIVGEDRVSPRQNLIIEFNNRIYDLTNKQYNYIKEQIGEIDQRNYDEFDKSTTDETIVESVSNKYYLIKDLFERMYRDILANRNPKA